MLTLFFRSIILYLIVVVTIRLMGKREMGQLQPFELVVALMIADFAAAPLSDISIPLFAGLVPIAALMLINSVLNLMILKSQSLRHFIGGKPVVLIQNGKIDLRQLRRCALTAADLLEQLRLAGCPDISQVAAAIYETSGQMSVFPIAENRSVSSPDPGVNLPEAPVPLSLIIDGVIQKSNLRRGGLSENWLAAQLSRMELNQRRIFLMELRRDGALHVQLKTPDAPLITGKASFSGGKTAV